MSAQRLGPRRLAEIATERPRRVLGIWLVLVVVALGLAGALLGSGLTLESEQAGNPESKQAQALIDERVPNRETVDELVVLRSERHRATDAPFRAQVRELVGELRATGGVEQVTSLLDEEGRGLVSEDGHATIVALVLGDDGEEHIDDVIAAVQRAGGTAGLRASITGQYTVGRDFEQISGEDLAKGELQFGLPAAMIVLLLVFGTLVGAAIPLAMALVSIFVALGMVAIVGQFFQLDLFITNMLVVMGLALGIDYSLFIVSRLHEERGRGHGNRQAILNVAGTATRAVVLSGSAFALALLGMFLVPDPALRSLALGAIVVGLVSVAAALTFHPALLMILGDRVDKLRLPWIGRRVTQSAGSEGRLWGGLVRRVVRRPGASLVVAVGVLLLAAAPLLGLKLGASGPSSLPDHTVGKQGYVALERDFPGGAIAPVEVVGDTRDASALDARFTRLRDRLEDDPSFGTVTARSERRGDLLVASVPLNADPSSEQATRAIDRLREEHVPAAFGDRADRVLVGGEPAVARDRFALLGAWLPVVIAFVLGLSFVLLTVAFRSIVIPLTAILVNLLSVGAAYGLLVLVFQHGVGAELFGFAQSERIEAWVPVFLFSVLFGLSMDYQVFLLSRIRERYTKTGNTTDAIVFGVGSTARLITGAALIIIVVFAGFAAGRLVAFQQMGFGVAVALLIDATIVRSVIIPAAMQLLGERNWYLPAWLERLPSVAIEGPAGDEPVRRRPSGKRRGPRPTPPEGVTGMQARPPRET